MLWAGYLELRNKLIIYLFSGPFFSKKDSEIRIKHVKVKNYSLFPLVTLSTNNYGIVSNNIHLCKYKRTRQKLEESRISCINHSLLLIRMFLEIWISNES